MFHKNSKEELEREHAKLSRESDLLHGEILVTPLKKNELMQKRGEIMTKIAHIQAELKAFKKPEDINTSTAIIKDNIAFWVFEIDGSKIPIDPNDLTVKIRFHACGHEETIALTTLIPFENPDQWKSLMKPETLYVSGSLNCQKCQKQKRELLEKRGIFEPTKPVGTATWLIRYLK